MKLINYMAIIETKDEENSSLLINTLNGNINVLSSSESLIIKKWKEENVVVPKTEEEKELLTGLEQFGYLVENQDMEDERVKSAMERCRIRHEELQKNHHIAVFVLTYQCNFACPYCYEKASKNNNNKIMSKQMVDKVFDLYDGKLTNISLYGGEPLLPETKSIIEYIVSLAPKAQYSIITNGYYINEFIEILRNLSINHIMVTLDGTERAHNRTRILKSGEGTFARIMKGIELCFENSIRVKIRMNISKSNVDECIELRKNMINLYVREYKSGLLMFELQPLFNLSKSEKAELNEKIVFSKDSMNGNPYKYNMIALTVSPILRQFVNSTRNKFNPMYCHCDAETIKRFYDPFGHIYSCILSLKNTAASIGDYYPEYHIKSNSIAMRNIENIAKCKSCIYKFLCGGGCANEVISPEGDAMIPNCYPIMTEIYTELPALYRKFKQQEKIT